MSELTEEDTFNSLLRISFDQCIICIKDKDIPFNEAKSRIIQDVAINGAEPLNLLDWTNISGNWSWEDFKEECIKRFKWNV